MRIRLAAQMQALALAMARENPDEPLTQLMLASHPEAKKMNAQDHHAISALTVLANAKQLVKVRMGYGRCKFGYELPPERKPKPRPAPPPEPTSLPPDIKVTVVKSGTLRIEFRGIRLEIGVADA